MTNEAEVSERFVKDVENHTLRVLHDDGLYRHLLCRSGESFMYWFEIITSPGQLTIRGDMGTYVFACLSDMFEFFGSGSRINSQYWAEKVQASSGPLTHYSKQVAIHHVKESFKDQLEYRDLSESEVKEAKHAFNDEVLVIANEDESNEGDFRQAIDEFNSNGIRFEDSWEWDLTEYDGHFLWCLHAILWAIREYRSATAAIEPELAASI